MPGEIVVGLDIGTTKICAVVGESRPSGVEIIGMGSHPSDGIRKGVVINIEHTVNSIKEAVEEAETMAGCEISSVYAGIAGGHIKGFNSEGVIALKEKEVTKKDIDRVIEAASAVAIPMDREVIHTLVQEFIVDDQDGIVDPLGMSGVRLEAKIHIVTGAVTSAQNIIKCANRAGLDVHDIILESLASSEAVLSNEERNLGSALIDFGGGTTDMAVFSKGAIKHTSVLPLGGDNLTYDIAIGLRTPKLEAEKIKIKYGCGLSSLIGKDETIEVPGVGGRKSRVLSRQILGEILEPRVEEIFTLIYGELVRSEYENAISSGVVITGGSAELPGVPELAEQIFNTPARVGYPQGIGGLVEVVNKPMYATPVGLVLYGSKAGKKARKFRIRDVNIFNRVMNRMKGWFKDVI
ncbi:MAG: cell division protein FtsA [Deltaproteobacteria bacterium]|nr:cell division protein FtsA [Deltaproteobacteria bacterium]MBW1736546.1 cell division protein FtsA [Deltaproteobacteria bacterium]MBW1909280.1 cell division protein FtsA [Deltaproteobacteria bacterium]MBW2033361.1 cell division protein FtsA [Deltaproteobacteria bacterium]MBW2114213.1 cell division protein FtsA [Deltaproteobacteria bacterium]